MKIKIRKIILCTFIFFAGIWLGFFWWNLHNYFWINFSYQPVATEVFEDDSQVDNTYQSEQEYRVFHGGSYVEKFWKIYFRSQEMPQADKQSFEYLGGWFACDKNNYYFWEKTLFISDGIAERWVYEVGKKFEVLTEEYAKDENYIYYENIWFLKHNDVAFEIIPEKINDFYENYFLKIWDTIYFWKDIQENIDSQTFHHLQFNYFKDKNWIYFWNTLLPIHKQSFEILDEDFIKDDRNVFFRWIYNPQLDAKSFQKFKSFSQHEYFLDVYEDRYGYYSIWAYGNNFYEVTKETSKQEVNKCFEDMKLCKDILWY